MITLDTNIAWQPKPTLEFFYGNKIEIAEAVRSAKRIYFNPAIVKAIQSLPILWD